MILTERILNCYAAANNVNYLLKKSQTEGKHIHIPSPISHSVRNAQDNFLGLCLTTEVILEQCMELFPQDEFLIFGLERWGACNFSYRKYKQNVGRFLDFTDSKSFYKAKCTMIENIHDRMFFGEYEPLYNTFVDYFLNENKSDYHNVDRLLSILSSCKSIQSKKLCLLKEYSNCTFLDDENKEMLSDIESSVATNQELLLHIDVSMNMLKKINKTWFDMLCQYYEIYNPGAKPLKINERQLTEAKKHLSILLWGLPESEE